MLVSSTFRLSETSEKTLEINVLNELAAYFWSQFQQVLTMIAPTQPEEDRVGFDEIIEGLPPGQVLAVQFKRPYEMIQPPDAVRFQLDTDQLNKLANNFGPTQAYLFLTPLPKNNQIVRNRRRLLTRTIALDIFDIPNLRKRTQKTRTVRVYTNRTLGGSPRVQIADPRKYEEVSNVLTVARLARLVSKREAGVQVTGQKSSSDRPTEHKGVGVRKLYYLHVANSEYFEHSEDEGET